MTGTLSPEQLQAMDAYWRAANYLSVGQIYLYDNPLLKEPLSLKHIKPRLLGGVQRRVSISLTSNSIASSRNRTSTLSSLPAQATAGPPWWPTLISRALTASSIPISRRIPRE